MMAQKGVAKSISMIGRPFVLFNKEAEHPSFVDGICAPGARLRSAVR